MIGEVHARLSDTPSLLASRRRLYSAALKAIPSAAGLRNCAASSSIDNPLLRGAVGFALDGVGSPAPVRAAAARWPFGATSIPLLPEPVAPVAVVDLDEADSVLSPVLTALDAGMTGFLTAAHGERFRRATNLVREGADLARRLAPGLVADLFPHVGLLAVLDGRGDPRSVLSASLREYPGLLMLAEPGSALDAAEALLHEAAHARFFDMAIVHDLLPADGDAVAPFMPSWRPGVRWPVEQAFAALHAYAVLAEFQDALRGGGGAAEPSTGSLLGRATGRVAEIGAWLESLLPALGRDAGPLVLGLLGRPGAEKPGRAAAAPSEWPYAVRVPAGLTVHPEAHAGRTVVARPGDPTRLYVLGEESALVLKALVEHRRRNAVEKAVQAFVREREVGLNTAGMAVADILQLLAERSLISLEELRTVDRLPGLLAAGVHGVRTRARSLASLLSVTRRS